VHLQWITRRCIATGAALSKGFEQFITSLGDPTLSKYSIIYPCERTGLEAGEISDDVQVRG